MNSSCAAVSQILLSLEDVMPSSPHRPPFLRRGAMHDENVLANYDSQSTFDGGNLALDDNRFVGDRSAVSNDGETQVIDAQINDCDETQYMERCCGDGQELQLGIDHTYAQFVDHVENSITLSVDNSPSLLGTTKLFQFVTSSETTEQTSGTTVVMNDAAATTADTHTCDVEPQLLMRQDIGQSDTGNVETISVSPVCSRMVSVSLLTSTDNQRVQLCGSDASVDVTVCSAAVTARTATRSEYVSHPSCSAVTAHAGCILSFNSASLQVHVFPDFFDFATYIL